jgi:hypothetical protein
MHTTGKASTARPEPIARPGQQQDAVDRSGDPADHAQRLGSSWAVHRARPTSAVLGFLHNVLHVSVNVDYNLRRQGKRFLAGLFFIRQRRDLTSPWAKIKRLSWLEQNLRATISYSESTIPLSDCPKSQ